MIFWWQGLLFFLLGGVGGANLAYYALRERVERNVREEERRRAQRKLEERGRHAVARHDAGPPAVIHRAKRKRNRRNV